MNSGLDGGNWEKAIRSAKIQIPPNRQFSITDDFFILVGLTITGNIDPFWMDIPP